MNLGEARDRLAATIKEVQAEGFTVWGFDDESIHIGKEGGGATWVDPADPDGKPDATPRRDPYQCSHCGYHPCVCTGL